MMFSSAGLNAHELYDQITAQPSGACPCRRDIPDCAKLIFQTLNRGETSLRSPPPLPGNSGITGEIFRKYLT